MPVRTTSITAKRMFIALISGPKLEYIGILHFLTIFNTVIWRSGTKLLCHSVSWSLTQWWANSKFSSVLHTCLLQWFWKCMIVLKKDACICLTDTIFSFFVSNGVKIFVYLRRRHQSVVLYCAKQSHFMKNEITITMRYAKYFADCWGGTEAC